MERFSDSTGIHGAVESLIGGRKENQDSYGVAETLLGMLVVVCDGMGGGPAGKVASELATRAIIDNISGADPGKHPASALSDAAMAANEAVYGASLQNPAFKGMGTTCVCLLIQGTTAYIVHIGDSRCYQLRGAHAVFRTADHSYVGEMVRHGTLTEEEARNSQYSNVITRAIGVNQSVEPEIDTIDFKPGDRFALMTDGIWGTLPESHLLKFLTKNEDPAVTVPEIAGNIDSLGADNGGGHDNLTLAIVDTPVKKQILRPGQTAPEQTMQVIETPDPQPEAGPRRQATSSPEAKASMKTAAVAAAAASEATRSPRSARSSERGKGKAPTQWTSAPAAPQQGHRKPAQKKEPKKRFSAAFVFWSVILVAGLIIAAFFIGKSGQERVTVIETDGALDGPARITKTVMTGKQYDEYKKGKESASEKKSVVEAITGSAAVTNEDNAPAVDNSEADRHFERAIAILDELKDYNPETIKSYRARIEEREKIKKRILIEMKKGIEAANSESKKSLGEQVRESIQKDNTIVRIDNSENKTFVSTADAEKAIELHKKEIGEVLKSN